MIFCWLFATSFKNTILTIIKTREVKEDVKASFGRSEYMFQAALWAITLCAMPSHAAPFAYVVNSNSALQDPGTVSVIDCATNTVTASITVGLLPSGIALTPDGMFAYVANTDSNSISVIATATNTVATTIPLAESPYNIALTPDGRFAYVPTGPSNSVLVIATATNTVAATIPIGSGIVQSVPVFVAITPDGAFAYVANSSSATVSVIATATNKVVATVEVGGLPQSIAITPNGAFAYVANPGNGKVSVVATASNTVVDTISATGFVAQSVAIGPAGNAVYVTSYNPGGLEVIATATNTVAATIPLGYGPQGVALSPNGAFAYVANQLTDAATVISTSTNTVVASVPVGPYPVAVAFAPSPSVISVTPNPVFGLSITFALTYSDVYGASDLALLGAKFNSAVADPNSCTVFYAPATNLVYLLNDAGTGSSSITPGSGTLSNAQCTIAGSGTSVLTSGNDLTLNLPVTASSTFSGRHSVFLSAEDVNSARTGWINTGTWTPAYDQPPALVSVTPNPASGLSNTFALTYSDSNGASDLDVLGVLFGSRSVSNSCLVLYYPPANLLYLVNDAGTGSSSITPGSGNLSNSQCAISGSGTSVARSGYGLRLYLDVTASSTYTGTKTIFMYAEDNSAENSGWYSEGTWTP